MGNFANFLKWQQTDQLKHFAHYSERDGLEFSDRSVFTATMLLLPGLRIVRNRDREMCEAIVNVIQKKAVRRGVMKVVNVKETAGKMAAWKYTRGRQHILVCVNFDNNHSVGNIICEDAPDSDTEDGKIAVLEMLSNTTYMRDVKEMRMKGLCVILYEYQIQVFEY